jgi:hypothetical protein
VSPDDCWLTGYLEDLRDAGDVVAMVVAETWIESEEVQQAVG